MTTTTLEQKAQKTDAASVSRLQLVREGKAEGVTPKIPQRGRIYVSIDEIVPDKANERKTFRDLEGLSRTIKAVGIIEPPTVVPHEGDKYLLTTGERRWRAARMAGLKRIPVIVGDAEDKTQRRLKSLISNVQRADLGPVELAQALQAMQDDREEIKTKRDLAGLIGKSEQWVGGMFRILTLPLSIQKKLATTAKTIAYDIAQEIARISGEDNQQTLLKEALKGATVREVRDKARELKGNAKARPKAQQRKIPFGENGQWVIIHRPGEAELAKDECIAALEAALTHVRGMSF